MTLANDETCSYFFIEVLGDLGRFSGACLPLNDQHLVFLNGRQQVPPVGEYWEAASDLLHGLLLQLCLGKSRGFSVLKAKDAKDAILVTARNTTCEMNLEIWKWPKEPNTFSVRVPFIVMAVLTKSIISSSSRISWYFSCSCLMPCSRSFLAPKLREAVFSLSSSQRPCSPPSSMGVSSSSSSLCGTS